MNLDYESRYGEHVGFCRVHRQRVLGTCDLCEDDDYEESDDHTEKCNYCGRAFACHCDWPGASGAMCPRCDGDAEDSKMPEDC